MPDVYDSLQKTSEKLGAFYSPKRTVFKVYAPTAEQVFLNVYEGGKTDTGVDDRLFSHAMDKGENGVWRLIEPGNLRGRFYTYSAILPEGEREAADPYAVAVGINGDRSAVVDLRRTDPFGWKRDHSPFEGKKPTQAVIYECHIRDLTAHESSGVKQKGKYTGLSEKCTKTPSGIPTALFHIGSMGVTHVQLLPIYDFGSVDEEDENGYNWGYDPKNYFAPEGSYSTKPTDPEKRIKELKKMIKAFHDAGIGVVMDVVFNHVYDADSFCMNRLIPGIFSRIDENGRYSNGSGCGNDTASERAMVRRYITECVMYWLREYHLDGFRFDLAGLLDIRTINGIVRLVRKEKPEALLYGEGWSMDTHPVREDIIFATKQNALRTKGFAYFCDDMRDALRGNVFDVSDTGYISGRSGFSGTIKDLLMGVNGWAASPEQVVNYMSCHDNMTIFDRLGAGKMRSVLRSEAEGDTSDTPGTDAESEESGLFRRNRLGAAIIFASMGIPFIMAGEELGRRKRGADGSIDENSYKSGDTVNAICWSDLNKADNAELCEYYRGLIAFRKQHEDLFLSDPAKIMGTVSFLNPKEKDVVVELIEGNERLMFIFNPTEDTVEVSLPKGEWGIYVDSGYAGTEEISEAADSVRVEGVSAMFLVGK